MMNIERLSKGENNDYDFDENEVDWDEQEDDQPMEVDSPDNVDEPENEEEDEIRKREELKQTHQQKMEEYPLWAWPLETGSKQVPELGLMNVDRDERSTRIFGKALVNHIWRNYPDYWKWRTFKAPEQDFREMISNENGRIDMDGICPYNSSTDGLLDSPTIEQIRTWRERRAKPNEHRPENTTCAGRDLESMPMIIRTAMKVEKMMKFMVEAVYSGGHQESDARRGRSIHQDLESEDVGGHPKLPASRPERDIPGQGDLLVFPRRR